MINVSVAHPLDSTASNNFTNVSRSVVAIHDVAAVSVNAPVNYAAAGSITINGTVSNVGNYVETAVSVNMTVYDSTWVPIYYCQFDNVALGVGASLGMNFTLTEMLALLKQAKDKPDAALTAWWTQIELWRAKNCLKYNKQSSIIKPQYVVEKLWEVTKGDAYVTSDVGQHQMWAAQYYKFDQPRRWINSGGLGTMGVGLPYAMGVQLAFPDAQVACITGESSIQMNIQELSTCKQYRIPVKVLTLNNRYMGMVRQWQEFFYGSRYAESYMESLPDFVKLAESYGHVGMRIDKPEDVEAAIREAFAPALKERMVFMDFQTDQTENVFPMVEGGKGLSEMILAEEL
jgi:acetolactate synthase-1/2/3 large subunit